MQEVDELALLEAWYRGTQGAREAEAQLYRRMSPVLCRFFLAKVQAQEVGDLVHTTWTTVGGGRKFPRGYLPPELRSESTGLRGFFLCFARYTLLRYYRHQKRFDPDTDSLASILPSASSEFSRLRRHERLRMLMTKLPLNMHLYLDASHRLDCSTRELAEMFEVEESTVTSTLTRARQKLHQLFEPYRSVAT